METKLYLWINSAMYLVFGLWCTISPDSTAAAVGLPFSTPQGFSEFIAVYGGLEFGVGVFFLVCSVNASLKYPGVLFGVCFYLGLAAFRTCAITRIGIDIGAAMNFFLAELFFSVWSVRLLLATRPAQ